MNKNLGKFVEISVRVLDEPLEYPRSVSSGGPHYITSIEVVPDLVEPGFTVTRFTPKRWNLDGSRVGGTRGRWVAQETGWAVEELLGELFQGKDGLMTDEEASRESDATQASYEAMQRAQAETGKK